MTLLHTESLGKAASYNVHVCGFDHRGISVTGQAKRILKQGLEQTKKSKNSVIEQYEEVCDLEEIAQALLATQWRKAKFLSSACNFRTLLPHYDPQDITLTY